MTEKSTPNGKKITKKRKKNENNGNKKRTHKTEPSNTRCKKSTHSIEQQPYILSASSKITIR